MIWVQHQAAVKYNESWMFLYFDIMENVNVNSRLSFLRCARQPAHTLYISKKLSPWYTHLHYVKVKQHFLDTWAWYHIRPDEFAHCPILQSDTPKVYFILAYTCWLSIQIEEDRDYIQATFKNFHNFSCLLSDS